MYGCCTMFGKLGWARSRSKWIIYTVALSISLYIYTNISLMFLMINVRVGPLMDFSVT